MSHLYNPRKPPRSARNELRRLREDPAKSPPFVIPALWWDSIVHLASTGSSASTLRVRITSLSRIEALS